MDLSDKRFHDLEELIKSRNSFHEWIREGKVQTQLFNQNIEKVPGPLLANVIKKEDEIIHKLKPTPIPTDSVIKHYSDIDLPPEYGDIYKEFKPLAVEFAIPNIQHPKIKPKHVVLDHYGHNFTGITLNNIPFILYTADGVDTIQYSSDATKSFPLTKGLKVLLEIRRMYKTPVKATTDADEANYLEIMILAGVGAADYSYIAALVNGERGTG